MQDKEVETVGAAGAVGSWMMVEQETLLLTPADVTLTVAFFTPAVEYVWVTDWLLPLASPDQAYAYEPVGGAAGLTVASQRMVLVAALVTVPVQEGVNEQD